MQAETARPIGEKRLTSAELAARYGIANQTVRGWRHRGVGPRYLRLGDGMKARVLYPESWIIEWEQARTFNSTQAEAESLSRAA